MKPRILALDTTGDIAGIALLEARQVILDRSIVSSDGFDHVLFDHLRDALAAASWRLADIDCFAAAAGPGSFTGVRVGLATVQGLAEVVGRSVVAVSSLAALAWSGSGGLRAPYFSAGRGEVYCALYDAAGALVAAEIVSTLDTWLATLPPDVELVPRGPSSLARGVGAIALREFQAGRAVDPAAVDASYVRRPGAVANFRLPSAQKPRSRDPKTTSPVNAGPRGPSHE